MIQEFDISFLQTSSTWYKMRVDIYLVPSLFVSKVKHSGEQSCQNFNVCKLVDIHIFSISLKAKTIIKINQEELLVSQWSLSEHGMKLIRK